MAESKKTPKNPSAKQGASLEVSELEQQLQQLTEALQRERADATNVRRRAEEDRVKMAGYYKAAVVRPLLPVVDNLERAVKHVPAELKNTDYVKGVEGILRQLEKTLEQLGVKRIATVGQAFDPRYHEAVMMEDGEGGKEVVAEELQAGYTLGDEVLRHAMVKVRMQS